MVAMKLVQEVEVAASQAAHAKEVLSQAHLQELLLSMEVVALQQQLQQECLCARPPFH